MSPLKLVVLDISVLGSVWHANRCARRGRITGPTVAPGQLWRVHLLVRRTEHRRIGGRCHRRQTSWLQGEVRPFREKKLNMDTKMLNYLGGRVYGKTKFHSFGDRKILIFVASSLSSYIEYSFQPAKVSGNGTL